MPYLTNLWQLHLERYANACRTIAEMERRYPQHKKVLEDIMKESKNAPL